VYLLLTNNKPASTNTGFLQWFQSVLIQFPLKMVQPTPEHVGNYMKPDTVCFLVYELVKNNTN
jgi:hypothetical protein